MKLFVALCIAITPFNAMRIFLYRLLLGYAISYKAKIRYFNLLLCDSLTIKKDAGFKGMFNIVKDIKNMTIEEGTYISKFNRLSNINQVYLGLGVSIGSYNIFSGTPSTISPFKEYEKLLVGDKSIITSKHIFDLSDTIEIGEDVTFGGSGSQIWTHGFDLEHTKKQSPITIGNCCYFGSSSVILSGAVICDNVSVGAGTVISKSITEPGFYVSSNLIKKSKVVSFKLDESVVKKNGYYFLRK